MLAALTATSLSVACAGSAAAPSAAPSPEEICANEIQGGPSALRRLTRAEYDATIRDLLGDDGAPARRFPPDDDGLGFPVAGAVSPLLAELYMRAAEDVAGRAVHNGTEDLLTCAPGADVDACVRSFIARFGRRAYRRPLDDAQVTSLLGVYRAGVSIDGEFADGIRWILSTMLQSPYFLYRVELGAPIAGSDIDDRGVPLAMHERASRLSYFLWGSMPDEELFRATDAGQLGTADQLTAQARRMLDDPRAERMVEDFVMHWLELGLSDIDKDPTVYGEWSPELAATMEASTRRFVRHVVFESSGRLSELFTARYAFVDAELAAIYGVPAPTGEGLTRVAVDPGERGGLLTHPALLTRHARLDGSSPIHRGRLVRERLLCQPLPNPPDGTVPLPTEHAPNATTRERFSAHTNDPACSSCHELMDPLGFAFEHYDGIGRFRSEERGRPVDARGTISGTRSTNQPIVGAIELSEALAASPDLSRCFGEQVWRFAFRRDKVPTDACSLDEAHDVLDATGGDVRAHLLAIVRSDAFGYYAAPRRP